MFRVVRTLVAVVVCLGAFGCSEDKLPTSTNPGSIVNNLVFERPDGSTVPFGPEAFLWLGAWEDGAVPVQSLHITVGTLAPGSGPARYWSLRAVLADVTVGVPLNFPNSFTWDQPKEVELFVLDSPNELSTADDGSFGSIVFSQLPTVADGHVEFTVDTVIGSELAGGQPLHVGGTFRGPVSGQPPIGKGRLMRRRSNEFFLARNQYAKRNIDQEVHEETADGGQFRVVEQENLCDQDTHQCRTLKPSIGCQSRPSQA